MYWFYNNDAFDAVFPAGEIVLDLALLTSIILITFWMFMKETKCTRKLVVYFFFIFGIASILISLWIIFYIEGGFFKMADVIVPDGDPDTDHSVDANGEHKNSHHESKGEFVSKHAIYPLLVGIAFLFFGF